MIYRLKELQGDTIAVPQLVFSKLGIAEEYNVRVALYVLATGITDPDKICADLKLRSRISAESALSFWAGAGLLERYEENAAPGAEPSAPAPMTWAEIAAASRTDPMISSLIDCAQTGFARPLTHREMEKLVNLYVQEGFAPETVMLCVAYVASCGKRTMAAVVHELKVWRTEGVETGEQADAHLKLLALRRSREQYVSGLLGISTDELTLGGRKAIARWYEVYGYDDAMVQEAAVQAGPKRDLWYWNSILKTWNAKGLRTIHDVRGPVADAGASRNIRVDREAPSGNDFLGNSSLSASLNRLKKRSNTEPEVTHMRTKNELYQEALRTVAARRQMARARAEDARAEAEAAVPALRHAEDEVRVRGLRCALAGASGKDRTEAAAALADARQKLTDLLAASGRPADALEPKFSCKLCQDTGTVNGRTCSCVHKVMQQLRRQEIEQLSSLSISSFDTMELRYYPNTMDTQNGVNVRVYMGRLLDGLKQYAEDFSPTESESLMLIGNAGLGKTHAALAIAGLVLEQGHDVIYVSSPDFFGKIEASRFDPSGDADTLLRTASTADLLILDDLGTEFVTPYFITVFYSLLNNRLGAGLPTIITTNITDGALLEKRYTEKISSRLSAFIPFRFLGEDIRPQKAAE